MAKSSSTAPKTNDDTPKKVMPKQRISLSEFKADPNTIKIGNVLEKGFRVWMKTAKNQSLNARTIAEWESLFNEYLKS